MSNKNTSKKAQMTENTPVKIVKTDSATEAVKTDSATEAVKTDSATEAVKTDSVTEAVKTDSATETSKATETAKATPTGKGSPSNQLGDNSFAPLAGGGPGRSAGQSIDQALRDAQDKFIDDFVVGVTEMVIRGCEANEDILASPEISCLGFFPMNHRFRTTIERRLNEILAAKKMNIKVECKVTRTDDNTDKNVKNSFVCTITRAGDWRLTHVLVPLLRNLGQVDTTQESGTLTELTVPFPSYRIDLAPLRTWLRGRLHENRFHNVYVKTQVNKNDTNTGHNTLTVSVNRTVHDACVFDVKFK